MAKEIIYPYIPNSVPETKKKMLNEINAADAEELYSEMIPERLRLGKKMNLPEPFLSEYQLRRYIEGILSRNKTSKEYLSFLGGGCWQHYVPAVCDVIAQRSEFLTAYAGEQYSDLGKFQALFEFQSLIGELVGFDVVGVPTYDWGAAAASAIRMASRLNLRKKVLISRSVSPSRLAIIRNFCQPETMPSHIKIELINYNREKGMLDIEDLKSHMSSQTSAVYFENPSYLGTIEAQGKEISEIAHDYGAESIVGVDPISLGILAPPADYDVDIACGEVQPLGVHLNCGGGLSGFIATKDEEKYVGEYPQLLISITETVDKKEYGFGYCNYERTSYGLRDKAKDYTGTASALWNIVAGVYLALMGPKGMKEIGNLILKKSHYAANCLSRIEGLKIVFPTFFKEFVVNFEKSRKKVSQINKALLDHKIFGGKNISEEFPELGESALYCVTEIHAQEDIERLEECLKEVL